MWKTDDCIENVVRLNSYFSFNFHLVATKNPMTYQQSEIPNITENGPPHPLYTPIVVKMRNPYSDAWIEHNPQKIQTRWWYKQAESKMATYSSSSSSSRQMGKLRCSSHKTLFRLKAFRPHNSLQRPPHTLILGSCNLVLLVFWH